MSFQIVVVGRLGSRLEVPALPGEIVRWVIDQIAFGCAGVRNVQPVQLGSSDRHVNLLWVIVAK